MKAALGSSAEAAREPRDPQAPRRDGWLIALAAGGVCSRRVPPAQEKAARLVGMQLMHLQKNHSWKRPLDCPKGGHSPELAFSLANKKLRPCTKLKEKAVRLNLQPRSITELVQTTSPLTTFPSFPHFLQVWVAPRGRAPLPWVSVAWCGTRSWGVPAWGYRGSHGVAASASERDGKLASPSLRCSKGLFWGHL